METVNIVRIPLRVANSYLVIGKKTIIVDTGDPGYSKGILRAMEQNGVLKEDVSMIFITHGHVDHFGSVYELRRKIDAPVAMQMIDGPYLVDGVQAPLYPKNFIARLIKARGKDLCVKQRFGLRPDIVFEEEMGLNPYGINGKLLATPGHTLGSASLLLPDGRAIIGDLLVRKYFLAGEPIAPAFLHDKALFKASMKRLHQEGMHTYYPGHGAVIRKEELRPFNGVKVSQNPYQTAD